MSGFTTIGLLALLISPLPQDVAQGEPAPEEDDIWDRLSFFGDGRVRGESTFDQLDGTDRHRGRLRLRVGVEYEIMEGLRSEARLVTSPDGGDANSAHWDFGDGEDGFHGSEILMDRLYLDWQAAESLDLRVGKFGHVFARPSVYNQYTWDTDIQPAGAAGVWAPLRSDAFDLDLRVADYVVRENSSGGDANMFGVQGYLGLPASGALDLRLASSVQWWTSLDNVGTDFGNQGNTTTGGLLDSEFTVWDSHLSAVHEGGWLGRQEAFVQFVSNLDADSGEDTGVALGLELGPSEGPGDTSFFLSWYDFDANAFYSAVGQDDTPLGGTGTGMGMTGYMGGVRRIVKDGLSLRLWALTSDVDDVEDPWRIRFDIDFKFR